jgi:predicted MPP superfamily phosphohydrolase
MMWLKIKGDPEQDCILVPGNHDLDSEDKKDKYNKFGEFYNYVTGKAYPSDASKQYEVFHKDRLQILALNSNYKNNWQVIDRDAFSQMITEANEKNEEINGRNVLRIAVLHHPNVITESEIFSNFQENMIKLVLAGHTHKEGWTTINKNDNNIYVITAGNFEEGLKDNVSRYYNLLEIKKDCSLVRVHTRMRQTSYGLLSMGRS